MRSFSCGLLFHQLPDLIPQQPLDLIAECLLAGGAEMYAHDVGHTPNLLYQGGRVLLSDGVLRGGDTGGVMFMFSVSIKFLSLHNADSIF